MARRRMVIRGDYYDPYTADFSLMQHLTVEEPEPYVEASPILDASGNPMAHYVVQRDPIGFLWHDENGELRPRDEILNGS